MSIGTLTIILGVAAFLLVMVALTGVLMAARSKLVSTGMVTLDINEEEADRGRRRHVAEHPLSAENLHPIRVRWWWYMWCLQGACPRWCRFYSYHRENSVTRGEGAKGAVCLARSRSNRT